MRFLILFAILTATACAAAQIDTSLSDRLRDRVGAIRSLEVEYHTTSTQPGGNGRSVFVSLAGKVDTPTSSGWMMMQYGDATEKRADLFLVRKGDATVHHLQAKDGAWETTGAVDEVPETDLMEPLVSFFHKTSPPKLAIDDPTSRTINIDGKSEQISVQTLRDGNSTAVVSLEYPGIVSFYGRDIRSEIQEEIAEFTNNAILGLVPTKKHTKSAFDFATGRQRTEEEFLLRTLNVNTSDSVDIPTSSALLSRFKP